MSAFSLPPFKDKSLWQQAMTHSSFANEQPNAGEHNERLEFLGDAILTFVSGAYLYAQYPNRSEGELTLMRAALVDKPQLCQFAQMIDLGAHLRLGRGASQQGSRHSERLLCSAFEAMIGAYFLDSNQDIEAINDYVLPMFETVIGSVAKEGINAKSRLQEWAQKHYGVLPVYKDVNSFGPDNKKRFVVDVFVVDVFYGRGEGDSKQAASFAAAVAALLKIDDEDACG